MAKEGLTLSFYQFDIAEGASINRLADFIKQTHGCINVLVNNATIAFNVFIPFVCFEYMLYFTTQNSLFFIHVSFFNILKESGKELVEKLVQNAIDTMRINYTGTIRIKLAMMQLPLRTNARVVNVASQLGMLNNIKPIRNNTYLYQVVARACTSSKSTFNKLNMYISHTYVLVNNITGRTGHTNAELDGP